VNDVLARLFCNTNARETYEKSVFLELHSSLRTSVLVSNEVAVTTVEMRINRLISFGQEHSPASVLDRLILWLNPVRSSTVPWLLLADCCCWSPPAVAKMISKLSSPWPTSKQNPKLHSGQKFQMSIKLLTFLKFLFQKKKNIPRHVEQSLCHDESNGVKEIGARHHGNNHHQHAPNDDFLF
jgi:hypothetical protein